jgi:glutathione S-transferase
VINVPETPVSVLRRRDNVAMLELHYYPSNASMAPHMLLEELGVPFRLKLVDRTQHAHKSPEYLRMNPNGLIPVLVDRDLVLYETAAVCLHLVDTHADKQLAPALGSVERAHFYKWLMWLTNTLQATLILYFYPERWADTDAAAAQVKAHAETKVNALIDQLDAELARHGGPWLLGEKFSAVDPYALMLCRWTRGFRRPARTLPNVGPYLQRGLVRPATRRVFEREGLAEPWV